VARKKHRGGRVTPKGTRPPHLGPVGVLRPDGSPVDSIIDSGGRELLQEDDPVGAEAWASALLGMFEGACRQARLDGTEVPPFEESLLLRCRQRRDKRAVAVAAALAGILPPPHDHLATTVISELRGVVAGVPSWVGNVGQATPTASWLASDVFGDQDSLIVGFSQEGTPGEHALVVLVDHNLSGQAKDAWIGTDFHEVVASWKSNTDGHMRMAEVPIEEALIRLRDAVAMSDLWNGDTDLRTEDFARHRALIRARLRRAGLTEDRPSELQVGLAERENLIREFMASSHGRGLSGSLATVDVELLAHHLVDLRSDYEGRPLRWSPTVVSLLLGDLAPRKLLLDADEAANLPAVVRAFVRFSADRSGLPRAFVDETLATVDEVEPEFLGRISDPAAAGPAKAVLAALQASGVDLSDVDAINEALQLGDPMQLPRAAPKKRRRTVAAPPDVVASAERSPVLGRLGVLATFYGDGRRLTQTGRPTLADAKELVALLGTRDQIDVAFGDRTFKTRSAAELPELGFTIRWAVAAGALRKEHGKLRATVAWGNLDSRPLERWMKAADALPSLGPLGAYFANNRYRGRNEILDDLAPDILHMLVPRPAPFDEVLDRVCERADAEYEWIAPYMQDAQQRRTSLGWDLDLLAQILGWAGMAERVGAVVEPDPYGRDRLVGGTLQLTTVGRWWLDGSSAR
jgi:hypothetical protein